MSYLSSDRRAAGLAQADFLRGLLAWRLWLGLGVRDIRIRYKRTLLGPWWITVSMAATFVCLGMLFSAVMKNDIKVYLPYLALGMVVWNFVGAVAGDGPQIFVSAHHVITSMRMPLVVHVLRCVVRNLVTFLHNLSAAIAALLILGGKLTLVALMLLVSLPLLFATAFAIGLILAIVGARFRDLGPVVAMAVQLIFFMTPIMWRPEDIPNGSKWWVAANPAYHLIEMVRAPLLGTMPSPQSCAVSVATATLLTAAAIVLYRRFRRRIFYWL